MNGYLVMIRHSMDDLPMFLSESRDRAFAYAKQVAWESKPWPNDASTPVCIVVIRFDGGIPTSDGEVLRVYEDEVDAAEAIQG